MAEGSPLGERLWALYHRLFQYYGPQHWWPAEEPFEVMVGAVLTQAAAWGNVEKAITNLKAAGALSPSALRRLPNEKLADIIHPAGYYNAKALKLKALAQALGEGWGDDLDGLFALDIPSLRRQLLSIPGIGEETADSIILYAARKPIFVIDAYTRRILRRLGLAPDKESYPVLQALFMHHLPPDEGLFNEYHALLVRHGKVTCRKVPHCPQCCLREDCPYPISH